MQKASVLLAGFVLTAATHATEPDTLAQTDHRLWPDPLNSTSAFDSASRAEILVFSGVLEEISQQDDTTLMTQANLENVNRNSVERVTTRMFNELLANFKIADRTCKPGEYFCAAITDRQSLIAASKHLSKQIPEKYVAWYGDATRFHRQYATEQVRLAAQFPEITSAIDSFSPIEHNGSELADKHFLLTFDDGPTNAGGNTDTLLTLLDSAGIHAMFYILGERLQARLQEQNAQELSSLYGQQCAAMHGWEHQSHARWENWQTSVTTVRDLIRKTMPDAYRPWFRPPYGQRRNDSSAFFQQNQLRVALWNIDSRDWDKNINGHDAGQRVLTLMLLWRHGVILFHDIQPQAEQAIPFILAHTQESGIQWEDCHTY